MESTSTHVLDEMQQGRRSVKQLWKYGVDRHSHPKWDSTMTILSVRWSWKYEVRGHSRSRWVRHAQHIVWDIFQTTQSTNAHILDGVRNGRYNLWDCCERMVSTNTHILIVKWRRQYSLRQLYAWCQRSLHSRSRWRWNSIRPVGFMRQLWKHGVDEHSRPRWDATSTMPYVSQLWKHGLTIPHDLDGTSQSRHSWWDDRASKASEITHILHGVENKDDTASEMVIKVWYQRCLTD